MAINDKNNLYKTADTDEAIFLRIRGILFVKTVWQELKDPNERPRAFFYFKQPPDEILAAWQRGDDSNVRVVLDAENFFRDEIRGRH